MSTGLLDVVDTAVKIGMGALVSGISTYFVTRLNHSNESERQFRARTLNIIDTAAGHVDKFTSALGKLIAAIDGVQRQRPGQKILAVSSPADKNAWAFIRKRDAEFCEVRQHGQFAVSQIQLIGISDAVAILGELSALGNEIRNDIIFKHELPGEEALEAARDKMKHIKTRFFDEVRKHYKP